MGRLVLWDIDGTLIRGGGVGAEVINRAAEAVIGKPIVGESVMMHGKTDPEILTELLVAAEVADEAISELLPAAIAEAERLVALAEAELRRRGEVIGGVVDVLARLRGLPGIRQSLANAQAIKRNADTVVDAITAQDIGALPDRSVTEALQRVPGVSINRFAGSNDPDHFSVEGSGVVVRGLNFVRSEFNGRDAFAAPNAGARVATVHRH